jgi:hypothetical protein
MMTDLPWFSVYSVAQVCDLQQQLADKHAQLCSTRTASAASDATMAASIAALEEKVCACSISMVRAGLS